MQRTSLPFHVEVRECNTDAIEVLGDQGFSKLQYRREGTRRVKRICSGDPGDRRVVSVSVLTEVTNGDEDGNSVGGAARVPGGGD